MKNNETQMAQNNDFDGLVAHIQQPQDVLQNNARLVINRHVTAKAWLTGYYIVEYEQKGADRAKYGEQLLKSLSERLGKKKYSVTTLKISFTHLVAILPITDPLERAFYETMAIRGTWSVRELQRQIDSNYYFRSGWSQKPEALAKLVDGKAETDTLALDIKSPFTFEFLGLQACLLSQEYHAAR